MQTGADSESPRRLIFYNDSKSYGGHDIQALHALRWFLRQGWQVVCYVREDNPQLRQATEKAAANASIEIIPVQWPPIRFHRAYHFFYPGLVNALAQQFRDWRADAVFVAQGNLEISALGTLAAKQAGIPCVSYIPMAHSFRQMGANKPRRRDLFNSYLATVPDRWLTISDSMDIRLRAKGARQPIDRIPNAVQIDTQWSQVEARAALDIPTNACVIGMAGRLNAKQKGTDTFVLALAALPLGHPLRQCWILLLGDGPDRETLMQSLTVMGWGDRIRWTPWTDHPAQVYPAFDLLVAPSRFEGLPITVQEALLCDVPVASSDVDGLGENLPTNWICPPNNPEALCQRLIEYAATPNLYREPLPELQSWVRQAHSLEAFEAALKKSINALLSEIDIAEEHLRAKA